MTVEERALRELPRTRRPASRLHQPTQQLLLDIQAPVARYLRRILTRERMRRAENAHQHLIQLLTTHRMHNRTVMNTVAARLAQRALTAEQLIDQADSPVTAHTDNGYSAAPVRCRYGTYGLHSC